MIDPRYEQYGVISLLVTAVIALTTAVLWYHKRFTADRDNCEAKLRALREENTRLREELAALHAKE